MTSADSPHFHGVCKIVSGGQTGVDQAALDVAIELGLPHGGWCPKGRIWEYGIIPERYALREHSSADYAVRTEQNILDSDGTLILYLQRLRGGTALTNRLAKQHGKPLHRIRMDVPLKLENVIRWLGENAIQTLNVAGPRASSHVEIYTKSKSTLMRLFQSTPSLPQMGTD